MHLSPPIKPSLPLFLVALGLAGSAPLYPAPNPQDSSESIEFARDIEPIFEAHCLKCHGPEKQKAGLRLDSKAAALAGSDLGSIVVIVPGDAAGSLLWQLVSSDDEDERMPTRGEPLSGEQILLLKRWIDGGAEWPEEGNTGDGPNVHWAYVAPAPPTLPRPEGQDWARNEIDLFVLDRLQQDGLSPAPEASPATLVRRLCLDLTGLPPRPAQIEAFESDPSPQAYEHLVDRLLASPHYGERQARAWLDLARYADTNGFEKDSRRTMWRYRDWVIAAYNADMGFDQFTIEQLAGDLLDEPTLEQRIATGFHRNTMINAEGGVDPEEYRVAAVIDRVNTTGSVWLGTTMACVQCHTHKYDPFSHRDYYRLFAYFNSTADIGPGNAPRIPAPTPAQAVEEERAQKQLVELDEVLRTWTPELEEELATLARSQAAIAKEWTVLRPTSFESEQGATLAVLNGGGLLALGDLPETDTYELSFELLGKPVQRLRIEVLPHETLPHGGSARSQHQNFVLSEVELSLRGPAESSEFQSLPLGNALADHHQTGKPAWPAEAAIDGDLKTGWAIGGAVGVAHQLIVELQEPLDGTTRGTLRLRLSQLYGSRHLIGHLRISASSVVGTGLKPLRADIEPLLRSDLILTEEQRSTLQTWYLGATPSLAEARASKASLDKRRRPPTALVMKELEAPRETHILERGSFLSPGSRVEPGVPRALPQLPADAEPNRLSLARWLVSADNPLTARVTVNRLWDQIFGRGIVATTQDFGTQGERPSHPELLDWLALTFQEDEWSTKSMLRRLVLSATYRQSSVTTPELKRLDPQNRLLARGARYRVEAEMVRDIALSASGLLNETLGGPSVFPPQPEGTWQITYSSDRWGTSKGKNRFRRGLYTFWRRTAPYPTFMAFDAPSRELTCVRRPESNTPLQALALLNDPAFVETAIALGARLLKQGGSTDAGRITLGFQLCTGRRPDGEEVGVLTELLATERAHYLEAPEEAKLLTGSNVALGASELDAQELAAWTVLANVLLNLDETITRS